MDQDLPDQASPQQYSMGDSCAEIHATAFEAAAPTPGLSWLDIGCGTGKVLRAVRDSAAPESLLGVDVIDWLDDDLRADVRMLTGPAEQTLEGIQPVDRVMMVEVLEHLDAPWTVLRSAAALVRPGGRIVVTTPNVSSLRHRLELLVRGNLTAFRPDNLPHTTPALPHVVGRFLSDAELAVSLSHAGRDVIPLARGRLWPRGLHERAPELSSVSIVVVGSA